MLYITRSMMSWRKWSLALSAMPRSVANSAKVTASWQAVRGGVFWKYPWGKEPMAEAPKPNSAGAESVVWIWKLRCNRPSV
jgi:hypothetical protein